MLSSMQRTRMEKPCEADHSALLADARLKTPSYGPHFWCNFLDDQMEDIFKSQITVRFANLRDVPTVARIYTSALCEDEVFDYVCCYRDTYREDHDF